MSDPGELTVGIVAEGPTDYSIFGAVLRRIAGDQVRILSLQPESSGGLGGFGPHGSGWKGVKHWCQETVSRTGGMARFLSSGYGPPIHLLLVHVDADVASESEVEVARPCPPASDTTAALRKIVNAWLGGSPVPKNVVIVMPSKSTEAWVIAALSAKDRRFRNGTKLECVPKPARMLTQKPYKHLGTRDGQPKKEQGVYEDTFAPAVAQHWGHVCVLCGEAKRFANDIQAAIGTAEV